MPPTDGPRRSTSGTRSGGRGFRARRAPAPSSPSRRCRRAEGGGRSRWPARRWPSPGAGCSMAPRQDQRRLGRRTLRAPDHHPRNERSRRLLFFGRRGLLEGARNRTTGPQRDGKEDGAEPSEEEATRRRVMQRGRSPPARRARVRRDRGARGQELSLDGIMRVLLEAQRGPDRGKARATCRATRCRRRGRRGAW